MFTFQTPLRCHKFSTFGRKQIRVHPKRFVKNKTKIKQNPPLTGLLTPRVPLRLARLHRNFERAGVEPSPSASASQICNTLASKPLHEVGTLRSVRRPVCSCHTPPPPSLPPSGPGGARPALRPQAFSPELSVLVWRPGMYNLLDGTRVLFKEKKSF